MRKVLNKKLITAITTTIEDVEKKGLDGFCSDRCSKIKKLKRKLIAENKLIDVYLKSLDKHKKQLENHLR